MKMKTYIAGPIDANNYLLWDENTKEAVLIDCSEYNEDILKDVKGNNLNVKYILLTHGHFDHVLGLNKMKKALNAKVCINKGDEIMLTNINEFSKFFAFPHVEPPKADFFVSDGDELNFGDIKIKVIETAGHTEGGVCYLIENNLFSGDTLFRNSYGRTDLFGGNFDKIHHSLRDIIFKLDDNIKVFTGHGASTTIGYEKVHNEINR